MLEKLESYSIKREHNIAERANQNAQSDSDCEIMNGDSEEGEEEQADIECEEDEDMQDGDVEERDVEDEEDNVKCFYMLENEAMFLCKQMELLRQAKELNMNKAVIDLLENLRFTEYAIYIIYIFLY